MSFASISAHLPTSRYASLPAWCAALILIGLAAIASYGVAPAFRSALAPTAAAVAPRNDDSDIRLYKAIVARVAAGESYYTAAADEQRHRHYPLHPFVTVRLPTLATIHARVGIVGAAIILWGLCLVVWFVVDKRLRAELGLERYSPYGCLPVAIALSACFAPESLWWHEPWALILMTLSLFLRSREHWVASVLLGLAAVCVRELALPYLCVMAVTAAWDGTRRECAAWLASIAAFGLVLAGHAHLVSTVVTAADLHSPGWSGFGGWPFVLTMAKNFTGFAIFPLPLIAILIPLSLLGLAGWRCATGLRAALILGGYVCAFMIFGRADNDYWGMMMASLLSIGLVFAPGAVRDLVNVMRDAWSPRQRDAVA